MKSRFPFTSFPNGWFRVGYSNELAIKEVKPLHYFGQDLVLFRTEDSIAHVMDAHCPHLGAHLGYGGCVVENTIQCPFHGWRFHGEGRCIDIPYTHKIPAKAYIKPWSVREINGLIMVWYHAEGEAPTWEIPKLKEYNSPTWSPFRCAAQWRLRSHIQEIQENPLDTSHLKFIHGANTVKVLNFETDGAKLLWRFSTDEDTSLVKESYVEYTYYGLGYNLDYYFPGKTADESEDFLQEINILTLTTPIDEEYVENHLLITFKKLPIEAENEAFEEKLMQTIFIETAKDVPILENKIYRFSPLLCEDDGPLMQYRRWATQFYSYVSSNSKILVN
ncbi:Rieske (2Fe-2S) region [Nostoc sp. NIES-4103]|nr:Rieske (2Fe-2S) region [Nostoc sp. NIES-4103]